MLKLKSIQCEYKGYTMRSILEKRIATKLDEMGVHWYYEPQGFKMKDGICYLPDFYLPDQKIWIEGKGLMADTDIHTVNCFVQENENKEPLLIVFPDGKIEIMGAYLKYKDLDEDKINYKLAQDSGEGFYIAKCLKCGRFYVQNEEEDYTCLMCGAYEGDHYRTCKIYSWSNFFYDLDESSFE